VAKSETKWLATSVLDTILTCYFRVLKFEPPASNLLPPVLEGLSRFAHLVNIDFFS
jgi:nucleolar complex protein 3